MMRGWVPSKRVRGGLLYALWLIAVGLLASTPWWILPTPPKPQRAGPGASNVPAPTASQEPIQPIPQEIKLDKRKLELGDRLFHDPRLSHDDGISCAYCHDLGRGGTDQRARSIGIGGQIGDRNAPTVFNSGFNFKQFWDGRAETLEDQIDGPIHDPREMGSNWPEIIAKLKRDPSYVSLFAQLYPDGIQSRTIKDAIGTFERSLITPNSRFDRFLRGETGAITEAEKAGYQLFKGYGCAACHQGINIGGNMFQKLGVMVDYFAERGTPKGPALGRYNVTGREDDKYTFKVPSLRNVARTAPYFHDGSIPTLEGAVGIMARYQLGRSLSPREVDLIVGFLNTLTGEYNGKPL